MKRMRLLGFMFHSPMNHTILSWAHPESTQGTEFARPEFWQRIARALERGKFDGLFLADTLSAYDVYRDMPSRSSMAISAVATVTPCGALPTAMPRAFAASRSM